MYEIIASGGTVGVLIGFLSLAAIAMVVEQFLSLRSSVLMPVGLAQQLRDLLAQGRVKDADTLCRETPSCLSYVVSTGLMESDGEWSDMEKALEDATAEQSAKLFRKVEFLSVIGNIAPMLGLLGTVLGMIAAFQQIAQTQGSAQAPDLARGIYQALVTTVEGLIVAIPALGAFAFFRNRVDQLMADVAFTVQHVFMPLKRVAREKKLENATLELLSAVNAQAPGMRQAPGVAQTVGSAQRPAAPPAGVRTPQIPPLPPTEKK